MAADNPGDVVAGALVASFDRLGAPDRLRVLRALQRLRRSTGLGAESLADVLDGLAAEGLVEQRPVELTTVETAYRCRQEVTGAATTVGQPAETSYAVTEKGAALEPAFEALEDWADEWLDDPSDGTG